MTAKTALVLLAASGLAAFSVGCSGSTEPAPQVGETEASLRRMKSCGELLTELKSDATFKVNHATDRQIEMVRRFGAQGGYYGGFGGIGVPMSDGRAESSNAPSPAPQAGAPGSGSARRRARAPPRRAITPRPRARWPVSTRPTS